MATNKESFGSLSLGIRTGAVLCENKGLSKLENTVLENACIDYQVLMSFLLFDLGYTYLAGVKELLMFSVVHTL